MCGKLNPGLNYICVFWFFSFVHACDEIYVWYLLMLSWIRYMIVNWNFLYFSQPTEAFWIDDKWPAVVVESSIRRSRMFDIRIFRHQSLASISVIITAINQMDRLEIETHTYYREEILSLHFPMPICRRCGVNRKTLKTLLSDKLRTWIGQNIWNSFISFL